jgi:predicted nucleic acid-binding protein
MEYEEIISKHMGPKIAETVLQLIENAPNVHLVTTYFKWELIEKDPDDNKFVDCAIACNAQYLVSDDKHFNALSSIEFPNVSVLSANQFLKAIKT